MELKIYSIKDTIIGAYKTPFFTFNDEVAKRMVSNAVNDRTSQNDLNLNAKDMQLYCLGTYEDKNGDIKPEVRFIANCIEFKKGENE